MRFWAAWISRTLFCGWFSPCFISQLPCTLQLKGRTEEQPWGDQLTEETCLTRVLCWATRCSRAQTAPLQGHPLVVCPAIRMHNSHTEWLDLYEKLTSVYFRRKQNCLLIPSSNPLVLKKHIKYQQEGSKPGFHKGCDVTVIMGQGGLRNVVLLRFLSFVVFFKLETLCWIWPSGLKSKMLLIWSA